MVQGIFGGVKDYRTGVAAGPKNEKVVHMSELTKDHNLRANLVDTLDAHKELITVGLDEHVVDVRAGSVENVHFVLVKLENLVGDSQSLFPI